MPIIVHIGYPKTATTWLQNNYFPFVRNAFYIPPRDTHLQIINHNCLEFNPDTLRSEFLTHKKEHLIFSLEGIVGTTHNFGLNGYLTAEHARRIYEIFPEAIILLFIRRQPDIIASSYVQYIKGGGTYSIKKYLYHKNFQSINGLISFSFKHFEYHLIIDYYQKLFGANQVYIYTYEAFADNPLSFAKTLSKDLSLDVQFDYVTYEKVNLGYRQLIRYIAMITNRFTERKMLNKHYILHIPYWFTFSKRILKWLNRSPIFGPYPTASKLFGKKTLAFIEDYYRESNRLLVEKYGIYDLERFGYPL